MAQVEGYISQIIGPVVDVHFPDLRRESLLPGIHEAMTIRRRDGRELVVEVQQHIGENTVRAIAMDSTDGLQRHMKVTALGGYIGRGVPTAFALNAPEIWNTQVVFGDEKVAADAEKDYPNAKIVDCTVTLRLGRNVKALNEVSCFGWQGYDAKGAETVWRLR